MSFHCGSADPIRGTRNYLLCKQQFLLDMASDAVVEGIGRGSPDKVLFVAAVQTIEYGQPMYLCLSQWPLTKATLLAFGELLLLAPATLGWVASRPYGTPASCPSLT